MEVMARSSLSRMHHYSLCSLALSKCVVILSVSTENKGGGYVSAHNTMLLLKLSTRLLPTNSILSPPTFT